LASLVDAVSSVTSNAKNFNKDTSVKERTTSNRVLAVSKFLVDPALRSLLNGMTAYGAYHSLKGQFADPSWLLLLSHWSDVAQAPDASDSISASYEALKLSLLDLEEQLGGWTTDKLLSLSFHSRLKQYHQPIAEAMNSQLLIIPSLLIFSTDILSTATWLHLLVTSISNQQLTVMGISAQQGRGSSRGSCGGQQSLGCGSAPALGSRQTGQTPASSSFPADLWGSRFMSPEFSCSVCWEGGHWAPDCPRIKKGLPPLEDPQPNNPGWRPKESAVISNFFVTAPAMESAVSFVSEPPDKPFNVLINSGTTLHVTSLKHLFVLLQVTEITLCVASEDCRSIVGVGDVVLPTPHGPLCLS
jgi:hypothetical protein